MGCDLLVFAAHRQAGLVPFGKAIFETPRPKPSAPQFTHGVIGVYAVGASAVGDDILLFRDLAEMASQFSNRDRSRAGNMAGVVLGLRTHIEHHHITAT